MALQRFLQVASTIGLWISVTQGFSSCTTSHNVARIISSKASSITECTLRCPLFSEPQSLPLQQLLPQQQTQPQRSFATRSALFLSSSERTFAESPKPATVWKRLFLLLRRAAEKSAKLVSKRHAFLWGVIFLGHFSLFVASAGATANSSAGLMAEFVGTPPAASVVAEGAASAVTAATTTTAAAASSRSKLPAAIAVVLAAAVAGTILGKSVLLPGSKVADDDEDGAVAQLEPTDTEESSGTEDSYAQLKKEQEEKKIKLALADAEKREKEALVAAEQEVAAEKAAIQDFMAEKAKAEEEARIKAEQEAAAAKARLEAEKKAAAEKARLDAEKKAAAEKAKLEKEMRIAEQTRKEEEARLAEQKRLEEEKAGLAEEKLKEEARLAAEKAEAELRRQKAAEKLEQLADGATRDGDSGEFDWEWIKRMRGWMHKY